MAAIEVIREEEGRLKCQKWTFDTWAIERDGEIRCRWYGIMERQTTRHKYVVKSKWDKADERSYNSKIKREEVPLPEDVKAEALKKVADRIRVTI